MKLKFNPLVLLFWTVCFLGGFVFGGLHVGLIVLFVSMVFSLVLSVLAIGFLS